MVMDGRTFRQIQSNCWDPEQRIEECNAAGVDVQVLSTVPVMFSYWAKPEDALDLSRMLNDHIRDVVEQYPTRFVGLGSIPMQSPDLAIRELERIVRELGFPGVQIGTHVNGRNLDDPRVVAVLECAADLGAAVFVHPWDMLARDRMERYWLSWLVGMPAETALAICSVIFGGVLDKLPTLRICFAHGGGAFPGTIGRIEHGYQVRPDLCAVEGASNPRSYLGRFFLDSLVHDATALRMLLDMVGAERIALGSDYPFPLGEAAPGRLIESLDGISDQVRERLLSGTAIEFLDIEGGRYEGS
jgi:aminocarboxymuconate-semialdehyde decarboxylase